MKEKTKFAIGWLLMDVCLALLTFQVMLTLQETGVSTIYNHIYSYLKIFLVFGVVVANMLAGRTFLIDYSN